MRKTGRGPFISAIIEQCTPLMASKKRHLRERSAGGWNEDEDEGSAGDQQQQQQTGGEDDGSNKFPRLDEPSASSSSAVPETFEDYEKERLRDLEERDAFAGRIRDRDKDKQRKVTATPRRCGKKTHTRGFDAVA